MKTRVFSAVVVSLTWSSSAWAACVFSGSPGAYVRCIYDEVLALADAVGELQQENQRLRDDLLALQANYDALAQNVANNYATETWVSQQIAASGGGTGGTGGGVPGLSDYMFVDTDSHEIYIEGANVHIRSGLGSTSEGTYDWNAGAYDFNALSGLGNLVIGYSDTGSGSHNLLVGRDHSSAGFGGVIVGDGHSVSGAYASAVGGGANYVAANYAAVFGGISNEAVGNAAAVCGGEFGRAYGDFSVTVGGQQADAIGGHDVAMGGYDANTYLGTGFDISLGTRTGTTDYAWSNLQP